VKAKSYIKTIPQQKIVKFIMGDVAKFNQGKLPWLVKLKSKEDVQIRDNALESARMLIHHEIEKLKRDYYFAVSCYPHHVLRENKMLTGAGADRMQTGMSQSFGVPVNLAARVKAGETIFVVAVNNEKDAAIVHEILKKAKAKLPCKSSIVTEKYQQ